MMLDPPENWRVLAKALLTLRNACDTLDAEHNKRLGNINKQTKKMSVSSSFEEQLDVAQCIFKNVKFRTMKTKEKQATHQRVALLMGSGSQERIRIKVPFGELVGVQR